MEETRSDFVLISMNESYAEVGVYGANQHLKKRLFLPKSPLVKSIAEMVEELGIEAPQNFFFSSKMAQKILNKRLGSTPALLVTRGFENWLDMNIPPLKQFFTVENSKAKSPLHGDYVFGVDERTLSDGTISKPISDEDLEFLASKLKLNDVESVAICYLHSNKNSENEQKTRDFLESKGFKTFTSTDCRFNFEQSDVFENERHRWWMAVLNAYIYPTLNENLSEFKDQLKEKFGPDINLKISTSYSEFYEIDQVLPVDTIFAQESLTFDFIGGQSAGSKSSPKKSLACYFGLENFFILNLENSRSKMWRSEFGDVATNSPFIDHNQVQPTSVVEGGFWEFPYISDATAGYEPGPMCFGRSTLLTMLDILYLNNNLEGVEGLSELLNKKMEKRIAESLMTLARGENRKSHIEIDELHIGLLDLTIKMISAQINESDLNFVVCAGPLAEVLLPKIRKYIPHKKFELLDVKYVELDALKPGGYK